MPNSSLIEQRRSIPPSDRGPRYRHITTCSWRPSPPILPGLTFNTPDEILGTHSNPHSTVNIHYKVPGLGPGLRVYDARNATAFLSVLDPRIGHDHVLRWIPVAVLVKAIVETIAVINLGLRDLEFAGCGELHAINFGHFLIRLNL